MSKRIDPPSNPDPEKRYWLRRIAPRGFQPRSLLILLLPLFLMQIVSTWAFFEQHYYQAGRRLVQSAAEDIAAVVVLWEMRTGLSQKDAPLQDARVQDPPVSPPRRSVQDARVQQEHAPQREKLPRKKEEPSLAETMLRVLSQDMSLSTEFRSQETHTPNSNPDDLLPTDKALRRALQQRIASPIHLLRMPDDVLRIDIALTRGMLTIRMDAKRLRISSPKTFLLWTFMSALLFFGISIVLLHNQARALQRLARAAEDIGKGSSPENFKPQGPSEVRRASAALLLMRQRLLRQQQQRTELLAGVSHDLRTPLTRMELQLALLEDRPAKKEMLADVREMENMIDGYLNFAREEKQETVQTSELGEILRRAVQSLKKQRTRIELQIQEKIIVHVRVNALQRCFKNLLANACRYGQRVVVRASLEKHLMEVVVDDDGPGIAPHDREKVFRCFTRLPDTSRSPDNENPEKNIGLGLSVARDIVHAHGGEIFLERAPLGGLRVRVQIPK